VGRSSYLNKRLLHVVVCGGNKDDDTQGSNYHYMQSEHACMTDPPSLPPRSPPSSPLRRFPLRGRPIFGHPLRQESVIFLDPCCEVSLRLGALVPLIPRMRMGPLVGARSGLLTREARALACDPHITWGGSKDLRTRRPRLPFRLHLLAHSCTPARLGIIQSILVGRVSISPLFLPTPLAAPRVMPENCSRLSMSVIS